MEGCGLCLYGKFPNTDKQTAKCMLEGYAEHKFTYKCGKYKRDFNKNVVTKPISVKKKSGGKNVN